MKVSTYVLIFLSIFVSYRSALAQSATGASDAFIQGPFKSRWQIGVFAAGGIPPNYHVSSGPTIFSPPNGPTGIYRWTAQEELDFFNAGVEVGLLAKERRLNGPLRGKGEILVEAIPFWLARYPKQSVGAQLGSFSGLYDVTVIPEKRFYGASVTPWLMRWNFDRNDSAKLVPWLQVGGGLLWTDHKFPIVGIAGVSGLSSLFGIGRGSSVINFTPQVDAGVNFFTRKNRSVNFAVKAVHISNASLGDNNPGLNVTLQFSAGYSWWK